MIFVALITYDNGFKYTTASFSKKELGEHLKYVHASGGQISKVRRIKKEEYDKWRMGKTMGI